MDIALHQMLIPSSTPTPRLRGSSYSLPTDTNTLHSRHLTSASPLSTTSLSLLFLSILAFITVIVLLIHLTRYRKEIRFLKVQRDVEALRSKRTLHESNKQVHVSQQPPPSQPIATVPFSETEAKETIPQQSSKPTPTPAPTLPFLRAPDVDSETITASSTLTSSSSSSSNLPPPPALTRSRSTKRDYLDHQKKSLDSVKPTNPTAVKPRPRLMRANSLESSVKSSKSRSDNDLGLLLNDRGSYATFNRSFYDAWDDVSRDRSRSRSHGRGRSRGREEEEEDDKTTVSLKKLEELFENCVLEKVEDLEEGEVVEAKASKANKSRSKSKQHTLKTVDSKPSSKTIQQIANQSDKDDDDLTAILTPKKPSAVLLGTSTSSSSNRKSHVNVKKKFDSTTDTTNCPEDSRYCVKRVICPSGKLGLILDSSSSHSSAHTSKHHASTTDDDKGTDEFKSSTNKDNKMAENCRVYIYAVTKDSKMKGILFKGDEILSIDDVNVRGLRVKGVGELLKGNGGGERVMVVRFKKQG